MSFTPPKNAVAFGIFTVSGVTVGYVWYEHLEARDLNPLSAPIQSDEAPPTHRLDEQHNYVSYQRADGLSHEGTAEWHGVTWLPAETVVNEGVYILA